MTELEQHAHDFAEKAHAAIEHKRKYTGDPYIVHPEAVAEIVRSVPHTPVMVAAAYLHDTVEDTETTIEDIRAEFGAEVAELVGWLTDVSRPEDGNRATRKSIDRQHCAQAPAAAQTIKVADLIHNSQSILSHDPHFAPVFLREKGALLDVLIRADPALLARARRIVEDAQIILAQPKE